MAARIFPMTSANRAAWAVIQITPPVVEPLTLTEAKVHLRRDDITTDDSLIAALIATARAHIEAVTNRALCTQTLETVMDEWPAEGFFLIPRPPLQSVSSVKYTDSSGTQATWGSSNYIVDTDSKPGRISPGYSVSWPTATLQPVSAIRVRYVAGHGTEFTFTADATTNELTAAAHGLVNGEDLLALSSGTLPGGLSIDTRYYVINAATNTFKVSTSKGGSAVDITSAGSGVHTAAKGISMPLRHAMLLLIGHYYQNRESVLVGGLGLVAAEMPQSVQALIAPYRIWAF